MVFASGGTTPAAVATVDNAGDAQFDGNLQTRRDDAVGGNDVRRVTTQTRRWTIYLRPGLTTSQKGSLTYRDWNGNGEWYLVKDTTNDWALNSATGGLDSFKAYQSTNSGDTYIDESTLDSAYPDEL